MQPEIDFFVVFWGARFRDFFKQFCLASIMAPNNMPVFSTEKALGVCGRLIVCSTAEDYSAICDEPLFERLRSHVDIDFIDIGLPETTGRSPMMHMSLGHKLALQRSIERKALASFLAPDVVFADGAILSLIRHVASGSRMILTPALRYDLDKAVAALSGLGAIEPGAPLAVSPRALARIGVESLHTEVQRFDFDGDCFPDYPISAVFADPGRGLIAHMGGWHPGAVDLSQIEHFDVKHFDTDTIDAHFIDQFLFGRPDLKLLNDSDDYFMLPLTSEEDQSYAHQLAPDPYLVNASAETRERRKIAFMRRFLFGSGCDAFKRWAYRTPVRIHYADLPTGDDPAAAHSSSVIDRALRVKPLPAPIHFAVLFRGEQARWLFLHYCVVSLVSPGNAAELAGTTGCRLTVATTEKDWKAVIQNGHFHVLQSFLKVDFMDIGDRAADELEDAAKVWPAIVAQAKSARAYLSFLPHNAIVADGAIAKLMELASADYDAVLALTPVYRHAEVWTGLVDAGFIIPGNKPIDVPPRDLARHSTTALHPSFRHCNWDGPSFSAEPVALYVEAPQHGIVMHSPHWTVLLQRMDTDERAGLDQSDAAGSTAAAMGREILASHASGRVFLIQDSDDLNIVRIAQDDRLPRAIPLERYSRAPSWVRDGIIQLHLAKHVTSQGNEALARLLFGIPVRFHGENIDRLWDLVEHRTRTIVKDAFDLWDSAARGIWYAAANQRGTVWEELPGRKELTGMQLAKEQIRPLRNRGRKMAQLLTHAASHPAFVVRSLKRAVMDPHWVLERLRRM